MDVAIIGQDNKSTMTMVDVHRPTSERTRHISVRYFWIEDRVDGKEITLKYVPTNMMVDMLEKLVEQNFYKWSILRKSDVIIIHSLNIKRFRF